MHKWSLKHKVMNHLFSLQGNPIIDLFAYSDNRKWQRYCSGAGRDKESISNMLGSGSNVCFSPFPLIQRVRHKVRQDKARVILITPAWLRQHWYLDLIYLSHIHIPSHLSPLPPSPTYQKAWGCRGRIEAVKCYAPFKPLP